MIDEKNRLEELAAYAVLDTDPEKELDELAYMASLILDTPISLITLLDEKRQWFKANIGLEVSHTSRVDSFCQYSLERPKEVLVVEDAHLDERFKDNPLVKGNPNIRFYAGAPLVTPKGHVLGNLCVIDRTPREISSNQRKLLQLLAKKVVEYLNMRSLVSVQNDTILNNALRVVKLTEQVPGGIFQFRMKATLDTSFDFISKGMLDLYPGLAHEDFKNKPQENFSAMVVPEDKGKFMTSLMDSYNNLKIWQVEFRVKIGDQEHWHLVKANPEKDQNGDVVWYGTFQDVSDRVHYEESMEQVAFDISHVLRKPVMNLLGLATLIEKSENLNASDLKQYVSFIKSVSEELDIFTRQLNDTYHIKKQQIINAK